MLILIIIILFSAQELEARKLKKYKKNNTFKYIIAPIFPFPAWQIDNKANRYDIKSYNSFDSFIEVAIEKGQNNHAGYDLALSFYKKHFGLFTRYEITSNIEFKNKLFDAGLVYRLKPKKHIRPFFAVAYKYLYFDRVGKGSGLIFSFINYEIMFTRKFGVSLKNFIGAVNYQFYIDANMFFLYKVYPSVIFKFGGGFVRALDVNLYALKLGISLRL